MTLIFNLINYIRDIVLMIYLNIELVATWDDIVL